MDVRKLKVVVIGDPQTGKSSLINLLRNKPFNKNIESTEEYQISMLEFTIGQTEYTVQLWDCGCKHLDNNDYIRGAFFRNASAAFLTFDVSNKNSLETVPRWIQQAYEHQCYLIHIYGMKRDLVAEQDQLNLNQFFAEYNLDDKWQLFSSKEYREKTIKNIFHEIDKDTKLDRSTVVKAARFSRLSNLRKTYIQQQ